jgi:threonine dehydratase
VATSRTVNARTGAQVFFKCENLQRAGAFKFRGAYNALSRLTASERSRGVVAFSSGNHAQAVALAGRLLAIPCAIVMPSDAPAVKRAATIEYGAEVVSYDRDTEDREAIGRQLANHRGLTVIPPYDHPHIIAGAGTAALELFDEVGALDLLLVPCGGGGFLSGSALTASVRGSGCRVVGVEPATADDATRSFHTGQLQTVRNPPTVADGARTPSLGTLTFPLVQRYVSNMVTVDDAALLRSMFFLWERLKLVVEPTGALAAAALLAAAVETRGRRIGVMISGGNVDFSQTARWRQLV